MIDVLKGAFITTLAIMVLLSLGVLVIEVIHPPKKQPDCPLPMEKEPHKCQEVGLNYYLTEPVPGNIIVNCVL